MTRQRATNCGRPPSDRPRPVRFSPWSRSRGVPVRRAPSWRGIAVAYGLIATVLAALYAAAHPEVLLGVLMGLVAVGVASRYRRRLGGSVSDRSGVDTIVEADSPRIGESTAAGRTSGLPSWSGSD